MVSKKRMASVKKATEARQLNREKRKEKKVENKKEKECSASPLCAKPKGEGSEETTWVCCDECVRWFHLICVGLSTISENEDFKCNQCTPPSDIFETTEYSKYLLDNAVDVTNIKEELLPEGADHVNIKEDLLYVNVKEEVLNEGDNHFHIKEELFYEGDEETVLKEEVFHHCSVCNLILDIATDFDNICLGCKNKTNLMQSFYNEPPKNEQCGIEQMNNITNEPLKSRLGRRVVPTNKRNFTHSGATNTKAAIPKDCTRSNCHHLIERGMHFNRTDLLKGYGGVCPECGIIPKGEYEYGKIPRSSLMKNHLLYNCEIYYYSANFKQL